MSVLSCGAAGRAPAARPGATGVLAAWALAFFVFAAPFARAQPSPEPPAGGRISIDDVVSRMNQSERAVIVRMRMYQPLLEVYIQNVALDEQLGWVPTRDDYFLGQFHLGDVPTLRPIGQARKNGGAPYLPSGFAAMAAPDWHLLERNRYEFKYVRREFLGETRCFVLDVKPIKDERDGFMGRLWVEDRDYNIVRFNGINRSTDLTLSSFFRRKLSFHMDGWRANVLPGVWVPSYVYSEETDLNAARTTEKVRFKSQTRIWGYEAVSANRNQELTAIRIDQSDATDPSESVAQLSPVLSQRRWEQEAEENIIERLEAAGFLAPPGEVDRVLETVVNNLVVSNSLVLERPLRCRILLTSPLESFTIGHTIVLSRGLIDVLPDEATLATMLAHELSHVALGHPLVDTKFAFADRLMVGDDELLQVLQFHHSTREETEADDKVVQLLASSPYKDNLASAGLFLRVLAQRAKQLPRLIQSHIGDRLTQGGDTLRMADLMQQAPVLAPDRLDQIGALPLGARLVMDPWSGRVALDRSPAVPLASIREKVPLAVTPLMPRLKYAEPQ